MLAPSRMPKQWVDTGLASIALLAALAIPWGLTNDTKADRGERVGAASGPRVPANLKALDHSKLEGKLAARVAVIEYSDSQCPYCADFALDWWPDWQREQLIVLQRRGKFWELHDRLFAGQASLQEATIAGHPRAVGVQKNVYASCMAGSGESEVEAELRHARALGLSSTPTFLVGLNENAGVMAVRLILGAPPVAEFYSAIQDVLAMASARVNQGAQVN